MKIKILKIYELNDTLRIETECEFGKDNIGLSLDSKYLDPETKQPKYLKELRNLLEAKYNQKKATKKDYDKSQWGKTIDFDKIK